MARKNSGVFDVYQLMMKTMPQFNLPRVNGQAMQMAVLPAQLWLQWQTDLWKTAASANAAWIARRQQGTAAALQALDKLAGCGTAAEAAEVQREWVEGAMQRLESDFRVAGAQATALPQEMVKAGQRAATALQEAGVALREPAAREAA